MKKKLWWTVGRLHDPQPEELLKPFNTFVAAEKKAESRAEIDERDVIAIWDQDSTVIAVYTGGMCLRPT